MALLPAVVLLSAPAAAFADPPRSWEDGPAVSPLYTILVLGGIPLLLFALIALAVYLPSRGGGGGYRPGEAWRAEPQWFGGPADGLAAADRTPAVTTGATSSGSTTTTGTGTGTTGTGTADGSAEPHRGGGSGRW